MTMGDYGHDLLSSNFECQKYDPQYSTHILSSESTVIVRVIAHAGVIAPLCVNFSSLESFNSFSAQGSESSHPGAMTPILVPPSSVRLHAVACGFRIKYVPQSVLSRGL